MKALGRCEWEDLKVGEDVFAEYYEGEWYIEIKRKSRWGWIAAFILASTANERQIGSWTMVFGETHKLSLADQRNWIELEITP